MRCYGLAFSGCDSRCYLPARPLMFSPRRGSFLDGNPQVVFLKPARLPSASVRGKAAVNDVIVSEAAHESFYELLGVPETGTMLEIKQAYKQLARKYHPDVSPPGRLEEYTGKFIKVHKAYETLSDPRTRALYDINMANGLHLAFSARKFCDDLAEMEVKIRWKHLWQDQLSELKKRSTDKDSRTNMSWGARMRRQRDEHSDDI